MTFRRGRTVCNGRGSHGIRRLLGRRMRRNLRHQPGSTLSVEARPGRSGQPTKEDTGRTPSGTRPWHLAEHATGADRTLMRARSWHQADWNVCTP